MKNKILGTLLTLVLLLAMPFNVYADTKTDLDADINSEFSINGVELKEGETVKIPITVAPIGELNNDLVQAKGAIVNMGNAGYIEFTRFEKYVNYSMHITPIYTKILCTAEVVDLTSGLVNSTQTLYYANGSISYKALKNHQFKLTIDGYAYELNTPVVSIFAQVKWVN